jgi:hypothetical protein
VGAKSGLGIVVGVLAFLVAGALWYEFFGMDLSFWVALAAGYFTFRHFNTQDMNDLKRLLNPPEEVWPVRYPVAWGCIMDVLKKSGVETGVSGRSMWNVVNEDDSRGVIQAKLVFNQMLGVGQSARTFPREIHLSIQLTAEGESTKVKCDYEMLSPSGAGMVRELIAKNQYDLRAYMEGNRLR